MKRSPLAWMAWVALTVLIGRWASPGAPAIDVSESSCPAELMGTEGSTTYITLCGQPCVIWSNLPIHATSRSAEGTECSGNHTSADGHGFHWQCETRDRRTFTQVTIDAKNYDLSQGRLLLVSARSGVTKVRQVDVGPAKLYGLQELAEKDPSIREFFAAR